MWDPCGTKNEASIKNFKSSKQNNGNRRSKKDFHPPNFKIKPQTKLKLQTSNPQTSNTAINSLDATSIFIHLPGNAGSYALRRGGIVAAVQFIRKKLQGKTGTSFGSDVIDQRQNMVAVWVGKYRWRRKIIWLEYVQLHQLCLIFSLP